MMLAFQLDTKQLSELAEVIAQLIARELREEAIQKSPWLTTKQAAEYLSLSVDALHRLTGASAIPHVKVSGRCLFNRIELDGWLLHDHHQGPASVSNLLPLTAKPA